MPIDPAALALAEEQDRQLAAACAALKQIAEWCGKVDFLRLGKDMAAIANDALANGTVALAAHDDRVRREVLEFLLTCAERTGPRNHNDLVVPVEVIRDCCTKPWKANACWICGKPKGQPPDGCSGHYEGTASDAKGGGS